VVQWAEDHGYLCYHVPDSRRVVQAHASGAGFPDWVFCRRVGLPTEPVFCIERTAPGEPRLVFAELKGGRRGAKASPAQEVWLAALRAAGAQAYLWYPGDWLEVQEVLR
jgi:hypothetical protein